MKITRESHPSIYKAFDDIIADNVASSAITKKIKKKLDKGYKIKSDEVNPTVVERFLSKLSDNERETLTMGDQDVAVTLFGKMPGFKHANALLGEFFDSM